MGGGGGGVVCLVLPLSRRAVRTRVNGAGSQVSAETFEKLGKPAALLKAGEPKR